MQYQFTENFDESAQEVKQAIRNSEQFISQRMSQLGLNKKKSDLNEDLQEYERDLRAKLDRK